jgi:hypothetical protein
VLFRTLLLGVAGTRGNLTFVSHLDQLLQTPPEDLINDLKVLRTERGEIEQKEGVLEQLLDMLSRQGGEVAEKVATLGAKAGIGPLRDQILDAMAEKTEEGEIAVVPQNILDVLQERGNRAATIASIRVAMGRMADRGELDRPNPVNPVLFTLPGAAKNLPPAMAEAFGIPKE